MKKKTFRKALSIVLALLMTITGFTWIAPYLSTASAASEPYWEVRQVCSDFSCDRDSNDEYANDIFMEWDYTAPATDPTSGYLKITFSPNSLTQPDCDFVYILTESGAVLRVSGNLPAETFTVKGNSFRLFFKTDEDTVAYGFDALVTAGDAADLSEPASTPAGSVTPEEYGIPVLLALFNDGYMTDGYITSSNLPDVNKLDLRYFHLPVIPDLSGFTGLKELHLEDNAITSLDGVIFPDSITKLDIGENAITAFGSVHFPNNLDTLDLEDNAITSISGVTFPSSLTHLYLNDNGITSLSGAAFPSSLSHLELDYNAITSLDNVVFPNAITDLNLAFNRISSMEGTHFPTSLETIVLVCNEFPFSAKADLDSISASNAKKIGYQGPYLETTRAASAWSYDNSESQFSIRYDGDTDYTAVTNAGTVSLSKAGTYWLYVYMEGFHICIGSFVKLGDLETAYTYDAGGTNVQADFGSGSLKPTLLDDEKANINLIKSEIDFGLTKVEDSTAILSFSTALSQTDTKRVYDFRASILYGGYDDATALTYTDTALSPAALTSTDLTGVAMRIPVSASDASKSLKLTVDGNDVNYTLTTSGGQSYVTFMLTQLGTYRLYAAPSKPSDSSDTTQPVSPDTTSTQSGNNNTSPQVSPNTTPPKTGDSSNTALWVCLGTASLLGLGVTLILGSRKRKHN